MAKAARVWHTFSSHPILLPSLFRCCLQLRVQWKEELTWPGAALTRSRLPGFLRNVGQECQVPPLLTGDRPGPSPKNPASLARNPINRASQILGFLSKAPFDGGDGWDGKTPFIT